MPCFLPHRRQTSWLLSHLICLKDPISVFQQLGTVGTGTPFHYTYPQFSRAETDTGDQSKIRVPSRDPCHTEWREINLLLPSW